mmetsp:Transcript_31305/g.47996  ORF Transcript_31305/g.47996 Transcript_31305/m.47996 type:complete len:449 (+) Transcript_31305:2-1348(+)
MDERGNQCDYDDSTKKRYSPTTVGGSSSDDTTSLDSAPCRDTHEILTRRIQSNKDCTRSNLHFDITPFALKAYMPFDDDDCQRPTIQLSLGGDYHGIPYVLAWMEMHVRSEHIMDGKRYDAELQMVHMGQGDSDYLLATVSVMVEIAKRGGHHDEFQYLLDQWQQVATEEQHVCGRNNNDHDNNDYDGRKHQRRHTTTTTTSRDDWKHRRTLSHHYNNTATTLLPQSLPPPRSLEDTAEWGPRHKMYPYSMWPSIHYYGYRGSITTPPCSDIVNWRILDKPMKISKQQYKQLTWLLQQSLNEDCQYDTRTSPIGENYRPLYPHPKLQEGRLMTTHCQSCTNEPTPWMKDNGYECSSSNVQWLIDSMCDSEFWMEGPYCQWTCFQAGHISLDTPCCDEDGLGSVASSIMSSSTNDNNNNKDDEEEEDLPQVFHCTENDFTMELYPPNEQ